MPHFPTHFFLIPPLNPFLSLSSTTHPTNHNPYLYFIPTNPHPSYLPNPRTASSTSSSFMASLALKKNYSSATTLHQFYTGGSFAIASDGSFIVCARDDAIKIVDSSNAAIRSVVEDDSQIVTTLVLSPDDILLFFSSHSR